MKALGGALVFLAEIGVFAGFGWWGFSTFDGPLEWVVGLGLPLLVAVVWGMFLSPRARVVLPARVAQVVRVVILLGGAAAFFAVGATVPAIVQVVLVMLGTVFGDAVPGRSDTN